MPALGSVQATGGELQGDIFAIDIERETLLLGRLGAFSGLPPALLRTPVASTLVHRLNASSAAMLQLRGFVASRYPAAGLSGLSNRDLVQLVSRAIASHQVEALVVGLRHVPVLPELRPSPAAPERIPAPKTGDTSVARWLPDERIAEVVRRTIATVPADTATRLEALLGRETLALIVRSHAFVECANGSIQDWLGDGDAAGIAFALGGIAGLRALGDVDDCLTLICRASILRDLEAAVDPLARAIAALGVPGLLAVLHKSAPHDGPGAHAKEEFVSTRDLIKAHKERMKARERRGRPAPSPPPSDPAPAPTPEPAPPPAATQPPPAEEEDPDVPFPAAAQQAQALQAAAQDGAPFCAVCNQ
jgi:hypothetical protein